MNHSAERTGDKGTDRHGIHSDGKQSRYLARVLVMTGDTILAESNPHDSYWGIGLTTSEVIAGRINIWEGNNAMGEILADIRKIFVAKLSGAPVPPHRMEK